MASLPPHDWRPPGKLLVVAASPRSGSNMLGDAIAATRSLGVPNEWLHKGVPWPVSMSTLPNGTAEECCRLLMAKGRTPNGVAAAKIFGTYFAGLSAEIDFVRWYPDVTWVWLRRRDLLRQAVSFALATGSNVWTSRQSRTRHVPFSAAVVRRHLAVLMRHDKVWRDHFLAPGISSMRLWYEDIVAGPGDTVRSIAARMDVDLVGQPEERPPKLQRQSTGENDRWVERFLAEPGSADLIARLDAARGLPPAPGSA